MEYKCRVNPCIYHIKYDFTKKYRFQLRFCGNYVWGRNDYDLREKNPWGERIRYETTRSETAQGTNVSLEQD